MTPICDMLNLKVFHCADVNDGTGTCLCHSDGRWTETAWRFRNKKLVLGGIVRLEANIPYGFEVLQMTAAVTTTRDEHWLAGLVGVVPAMPQGFGVDFGSLVEHINQIRVYEKSFTMKTDVQWMARKQTDLKGNGTPNNWLEFNSIQLKVEFSS